MDCFVTDLIKASSQFLKHSDSPGVRAKLQAVTFDCLSSPGALIGNKVLRGTKLLHDGANAFLIGAICHSFRVKCYSPPPVFLKGTSLESQTSSCHLPWTMVSLSIQTGKLGLEFFPLHHTDFPSRSDKLTFLQGLQQCYQPSFTKQSTFILRVKALQRKQKNNKHCYTHAKKLSRGHQ